MTIQTNIETPAANHAELTVAAARVLAWFKDCPGALSTAELILPGCPNELSADLDRLRAAMRNHVEASVPTSAPVANRQNLHRVLSDACRRAKLDRRNAFAIRTSDGRLWQIQIVADAEGAGHDGYLLHEQRLVSGRSVLESHDACNDDHWCASDLANYLAAVGG